MKDTERKPDITYYRNTTRTAEQDESGKAKEADEKYLSATLSSPNSLSPRGGNVLLIISLKNISETELSDIVISDKLTDVNMKYVKNSAVLYDKNSEPEAVDADDREEGVSFLIGKTLEPGDIVYLSFLAQFNDAVHAETIYNYATVTDQKHEFKIITNSVKINLEFSEITAEKSYVKKNNSFTQSAFILMLKNTGNTTCKNVTVSDKLPENFIVSDVYYNENQLSENVDYTYVESKITINVPDEIHPSETSNIYIYSRNNG